MGGAIQSNASMNTSMSTDIGKNKRENKTLKRSGCLRDGVICYIFSNARDVEHWVQLFIAVLRACILLTFL
jgi:hypothetical protein